MQEGVPLFHEAEAGKSVAEPIPHRILHDGHSPQGHPPGMPEVPLVRRGIVRLCEIVCLRQLRLCPLHDHTLEHPFGVIREEQRQNVVRHKVPDAHVSCLEYSLPELVDDQRVCMNESLPVAHVRARSRCARDDAVLQRLVGVW